MTDYPIIFSAPMVRALLDGRKTMTRRLARRRDKSGLERATPWVTVIPGDLLWVRESCWTFESQDVRHSNQVQYMADDGARFDTPSSGHWICKTRPSIHMPRWASRLTLIVTATKVEPLQNISEEDAKAEGAELVDEVTGRISLDDRRGSYRLGFEAIWRQIHGAESWDANPEVVALTFRVIRENIDRIKEVNSND